MHEHKIPQGGGKALKTAHRRGIPVRKQKTGKEMDILSVNLYIPKLYESLTVAMRHLSFAIEL